MVAFVNNDTIAVVQSGTSQDEKDGISLWNINQDNGHINLSFSRRILGDQKFPNCKIATCIIGDRNFLAIHPSSNRNQIIFYDLINNESVSRTFPGDGFDLELYFSQNG